MQQQISVITLGTLDRARSRQFYTRGFGWTPVFENDEIIFFQMNGMVLGLWTKSGLAADSGCADLSIPGAVALAHNVESREAVETVMAELVAAGGTMTRKADAPPHGGYRGYVSDPDGHLWEIAWNPAWAIDAAGHVTFGL